VTGPANSPRHVALNALWLDPDRPAGPETYLRGLAPALAREFPALRLSVITTPAAARALHADGWSDWCSLIALGGAERGRAARLYGELARFPRTARARGADLLHSLASTGPFSTRVPHVLTLHDVTFLHIRTFPLSTTVAMGAVAAASAHTAAALITGSAAAADQIAATLRLRRADIAVVPHGAGRMPETPPADAAALRERLGIAAGARVALCVAAVRPHKNQELLVRALRSLGSDVVLVLAGKREPYADDVLRLAGELGVEDRLRLTGYVDDAELEALWRMAGCLAFPTLAEGFGLPVLEAMQRGAPVACSDIPVLREVGGDVPHYFDPHDPTDAGRAIADALAAGGSRAAARERVAGFSWEAAAHGTWAAYERALAR
jgi:glycosyltransferase involved in cell wall biosynthesis